MKLNLINWFNLHILLNFMISITPAYNKIILVKRYYKLIFLIEKCFYLFFKNKVNHI